MSSRQHETNRIARFRQYAILLTSIICGLLLIGLTAVTVIDVIGRYIFNAPLSGATELTEFLLLGIIFVGLPAITLDDDHIAIDLVTAQLPTSFATILRVFAQALSVAFFGVLGWQLLQHANRLELYQDITVYLRIPFAPFCTAAAYLMMLCSLIVFAQMIAPLMKRKQKATNK